MYNPICPKTNIWGVCVTCFFLRPSLSMIGRITLDVSALQRGLAFLLDTADVSNRCLNPAFPLPPCPQVVGSLKTCDESFNNGVSVAGGSCSLPQSSISKPPVIIDEEFISDKKKQLKRRYNVCVQRKSPPTGCSTNCVKLLAGSFLPCLYFVSEVSFDFSLLLYPRR